MERLARMELDRDEIEGAAETEASVGKETLVEQASTSSGQSLPATLQRKFEASLGADLSGVRVHTGDESQDAAEAVSARAYTVGNDIHFGAGQFDPSSGAGEELLAHEVAHTVQQAGGASRKPMFKLDVSSPGDSHEVEADAAAAKMVAGESAEVGSASGVARKIMRDAKTPAGPADSKGLQDKVRAAITSLDGGQTDLHNVQAEAGKTIGKIQKSLSKIGKDAEKAYDAFNETARTINQQLIAAAIDAVNEKWEIKEATKEIQSVMIDASLGLLGMVVEPLGEMALHCMTADEAAAKAATSASAAATSSLGAKAAGAEKGAAGAEKGAEKAAGAEKGAAKAAEHEEKAEHPELEVGKEGGGIVKDTQGVIAGEKEGEGKDGDGELGQLDTADLNPAVQEAKATQSLLTLAKNLLKASKTIEAMHQATISLNGVVTALGSVGNDAEGKKKLAAAQQALTSLDGIQANIADASANGHSTLAQLQHVLAVAQQQQGLSSVEEAERTLWRKMIAEMDAPTRQRMFDTEAFKARAAALGLSYSDQGTHYDKLDDTKLVGKTVTVVEHLMPEGWVQLESGGGHKARSANPQIGIASGATRRVISQDNGVLIIQPDVEQGDKACGDGAAFPQLGNDLMFPATTFLATGLDPDAHGYHQQNTSTGVFYVKNGYHVDGGQAVKD